MATVEQPVSVWQQVQEAFKCEHSKQEVRYKEATNGVLHYRMQCLRCGALVRALKKDEVLRMSPRQAVTPFDDALMAAWGKRISVEYARRQQAARDAESSEWWSRYNAYLESPGWRERRERVLRRDQYLCQGCLLYEATQVHHLTYQRMGNEMMFDLLSVCDDCHERLHEQSSR